MTLAAVVEPAYQNARLNYTVPAGGVSVTISRTGPSGIAATVRGWLNNPAAPGLILARDYEAPIGVPVTYTATTKNISATVIDTQTAALTIASGGCADTWLNDLARVGNTLQVVLEQIPELDYVVPASVHEVITRRAPIVTSDIAHTATLEVSILTASHDERARARAMLGNGLPILLRTPPENGVGNMYLSVLDFKEQRIVAAGTVPDRRFVISARQVDRPAPGLFAPQAPVIYEDLRSAFAAYGDLRASRANYDALLYSWTGTAASDIVPWPPTDV